MAEHNPMMPAGQVPPKPAEAAKIQSKKETTRINLPPKPTAAPTIKIPSPAAISSAAPAAPAPIEKITRTPDGVEELRYGEILYRRTFPNGNTERYNNNGVVYERIFADGSREVYDEEDGGTLHAKVSNKGEVIIYDKQGTVKSYTDSADKEISIDDAERKKLEVRTYSPEDIESEIEKALKGGKGVTLKNVEVETREEHNKMLVMMAEEHNKIFVRIDMGMKFLFSKTDFKLEATFESDMGPIKKVEWRMDGTGASEKASKIIEPQLENIAEILKYYIEKKEGRKVAKVEIVNRRILVTFGEGKLEAESPAPEKRNPKKEAADAKNRRIIEEAKKAIQEKDKRLAEIQAKLAELLEKERGTKKKSEEKKY